MEDSGIYAVPLNIQQRLVHLCEESIQGQGYIHIRLKKQCLVLTQRLGIVPASVSHSGKPCNARDIE